jgi:chromosome partitioning protein
MAKVIAIANHKGGVGKTTTALNLAVALAMSGKRTLAIDLDFQGNLSASLGVDLEDLEERRKTAHRMMLDEKGDYSNYLVNVRPRLELLPACLDSDAEKLLEAQEISKELLLRERLQPAESHYDYCVIDTPPSLRAPTLNALAMSDLTIVPIESGIFALLGLNQLLRTVGKIRRTHCPDMLIMALSTMFSSRQNLDKDVRQRVIGKFTEEYVLSTTIPRAVAIGEANADRKAIVELSPESPGGFAFKKLVHEIKQVFGDEQETKRTNKRQSR